MVSIIPPERSGFDVIGKQLGQSLQNNLGPAMQRQNERQMNSDALDRAQAEIAQANGDPYKIAMIMARAGLNAPNLQRSLAPLAETAIKYGKMQRESNAPSPSDIGKQPQPRQHEAPPAFQPGAPIGENAPTNQFFPSNKPLSGETGNLPQAATTNKIEKLRTPAEVDRDTKTLNAARRKEGIIEPLSTTRQDILGDEAQKERYNSQIEKEQENRKTAQRDYGAIGEKALIDVFPKATPEQTAIFKRKAENAAASGKSEAEIEQSVVTDAKNFADTIKNVTTDMTAPRVIEDFKRKFQGTQKDFESAAKDLRVKLKPILDLGLYDTARDLLTDLGYYPEERDQIINPMGEREKVVLNRVPKSKSKINTKGLPPAGGFEGIGTYQEKTPENIEDVKMGLRDLKEANPNFSLVLARKSFEDKNYNWRVFKDTLNDMILDGEIKLEGDQQKQLKNLDTPPLTTLEKILHGMNLIGR